MRTVSWACEGAYLFRGVCVRSGGRTAEMLWLAGGVLEAVV